jgi:SpoVK/Ycf46/Vps4 family AAA+-type ATPase
MKLDPSSLSNGGKIILLHGPAGTGKTTLIRAIIREWKEWCDVEYIIDPEVILNSSNYLTQVVLGNDDDEDDEMFNEILHFLNKNSPSDTSPSSKFRLLIFEDTEDLIASDDKGSVSASVSRLLNIGDGLLGQGLKILILITTNVKLDKLHPALVRPGRTLANIHVPKLSTEEATKWLGSNSKEATLAELYEEKSKKQIVAVKKEIELPGTYL